MRYIFIILTFIVAINPKLRTQVVTQVKAEQLGNSVLVNYYLHSEFPCEVKLQVSTDSGHIFTTPTNGLSGDIGKNISQGKHLIRWEVLESMEALASSNVCFKVVAETMYAFRTVQIGNQRWMAENLNIDRFRNGDIIPEARSIEEWKLAGQSKQPAWCYYENDSTDGNNYGKLYNWYAVNDSRGLAPYGWHIPNDTEWTLLTDYLGGQKIAGAKMKSTSGWRTGGDSGIGIGFNGEAAGCRNSEANFFARGENALWWTSSECEAITIAWRRYLYYGHNHVKRDWEFKTVGLSVRCLKD